MVSMAAQFLELSNTIFTRLGNSLETCNLGRDKIYMVTGAYLLPMIDWRFYCNWTIRRSMEHTSSTIFDLSISKS